MLSIIMSGLNAAQKDLSVTSNNLANAGTTGFKRSDASFLDLYSNDPSSNPKTQIGGGTALGEITRSTAQGPMKTTGNALDLAISGRGFFTLARADNSLIYTRAGNFTARVDGSIVDAADNQLQGFQVDEKGVALKSQPLTNFVVPAEKPNATVRVPLDENAGVGTLVWLTGPSSVNGVRLEQSLSPKGVVAADLLAGYVTFEVPSFPPEVINNLGAEEYLTKLSVPIGSNSAGRTLSIKSGTETVKSITLKGDEVSPLSVILPSKYLSSTTSFASLSATFDNGEAVVPPGGFDFNTSYAYGPLTANYQKVFTQDLSIDTKGLIHVNFSDGTSSPIGSIAIANFPYEPGLRAIGDTNFAQSVDSGQPVMTEAGAPAAGEIRSGMLEESNVDMTAELMQMLKAQQVYNGNARMMQTSVDLVTRITDKL